MPLFQQGLIFAAVSFARRDEAYAAMPMFFVVPSHEVMHPLPCSLQTGKAIGWPLRAVLQRAEQRLRVRIIVADPWSTARGTDAKIMHLGQQGS